MSEVSESEEKEVVEEGKGIKAKDASLVGKIIGGIEILAGSIALVVLTCLGKVSVDDAKTLLSVVMTSGFGIMGVFTTVDINLMLDKFTRK